MILRRLASHVKAQNWFAVALDFVIVVIGVGVALTGQQWLSDGQQRADLALAETALQGDLLNNYIHAKERLAVSACRKEAYQAIAAQLLEPGETWTGMPRIDEVEANGYALPNLMRSPYRNWVSRNWEAGLARGAFNQMDNERRRTLDAVFKQTQVTDLLQQDIFALQGRMKKLAVTSTISFDDRSRYYDMLGELDDKSQAMELHAGQLIAKIEAIGIDLSAEDRAGAVERYPRFNARGAAVYGECFAPLEWNVLNNNLSGHSPP